jgi:CrcB protein
MGFYALFAVFSGAGLGAVLRWQPGLLLNLLFPTVPPGTLVANLFGGYLIGVTVVFFFNVSLLLIEREDV